MPALGSVEQQAVDDARLVAGVFPRCDDDGFAFARNGARDGIDQCRMGDHQLVAGGVEFLDCRDQLGGDLIELR